VRRFTADTPGDDACQTTGEAWRIRRLAARVNGEKQVTLLDRIADGIDKLVNKEGAVVVPANLSGI
jgi:hypothetical protein